ncbi:hypothetical protein, partial [Enterococcus faecium]|uniref:hypothetical protein n=1 Tax=Enterococcus faecium TaxID=1352 RepID=UPI003F51C3F9
MRMVFLPVIHMVWNLSRRTKPVDSRTPPDALTGMSPEARAAAERRTRMIGYLLLVATSVGWGLNWPVTKH